MVDFVTILITVGIITVEIAVLVVLYRNYITNWNAEKWVEKAQDGDWMVGLLSPVIDSIVDDTTDSIISKMKMELLSGQGQISRASLAEIETPEELMMKLSEELIKSTGIKSIPPMLQVKMAQGMGNLASNLLSDKQQEKGLQIVKTGKELLNQRLF
jgi:hypothetical protein